ncbi:MAG TPA: LLM class flavin-dependent oxidoreductase [Acetobacteraceae bacterium]|nr:LLM class flavin-dependent oxidoreductase [Acetobacteraceae bacterium]
MTLILDTRLQIGIQTVHRRTEPADAPWHPTIDELVSFTKLVDRCGYDSLWVGDHISFPVTILDPLLQLAQCAVASRRLALGTGVYLLPLRHPVPVAKQVASLDHLTEGRLIFGVGVGGEFPKEYEACGVPRAERGARLTEGVDVLRKLWTGAAVSHTGRFYGPFTDVPMAPPPRQPGGPPIWFGGRSAAALRRTARLGDGYLSYVVTPEMYRAALATIAAAWGDRTPARFGTGHLLFARLDKTYEEALDAATETLSVRYAMDFRRAAQRYCALGPPSLLAERIRAFHAAGVRHVVLDLLGPPGERDRQIEWFATDVMPLLHDLTVNTAGELSAMI